MADGIPNPSEELLKHPRHLKIRSLRISRCHLRHGLQEPRSRGCSAFLCSMSFYPSIFSDGDRPCTLIPCQPLVINRTWQTLRTASGSFWRKIDLSGDIEGGELGCRWTRVFVGQFFSWEMYSYVSHELKRTAKKKEVNLLLSRINFRILILRSYVVISSFYFKVFFSFKRIEESLRFYVR